jgi:DNA processing protein
MDHNSEIRARLALMIAAGGSPSALRRILRSFPTALEAKTGSSLPARIRQGLQSGSIDDKVDQQLESAAAIQAKWVLPQSISAMGGRDEVALLCVRGHLSSMPAVAVVGARQADEYGRLMAMSLGSALASGGISVVSGAASGVDEVAHRAVLNAHGHTVAVLGTGLLGERNRARTALHDAIIAGGGALVSQYLIDAKGARWTFPERNHIIARWGCAVVVVQARRKSGALITAQAALETNVPVFAIPGDACHPLSEGTNILIAQGDAQLLQHVSGLAAVTGVSDLHSAPWPSNVRLDTGVVSTSMGTTGLNERNKVLQVIAQQPGVDLESLGERVGLLNRSLAEVLLDLELDNQVKRRPDDTYEVRQ